MYTTTDPHSKPQYGGAQRAAPRDQGQQGEGREPR